MHNKATRFQRALCCLLILTANPLALGADRSPDAKIRALINELAISDKAASPEPFITIDNPKNAELLRQVHATAKEITKYGSAAFPRLLDSLDDQRQSVPFRRVLPSTVGDACLSIIMGQVYALPEGYSQTASLYRRGADGKLHEQPVWSKQIYDEVGARKWLTDRRGKALQELRIEAVEWVLATQKEIGSRNKEERDEYIAPLEEHLKKLRSEARQAGPTNAIQSLRSETNRAPSAANPRR